MRRKQPQRVEHLISRKPRCTPCPRCGALCLHGIDEGVPYKVDIIPINLDGELVARFQGRMTYQLQTGFLMRRNQFRMQSDVRNGRARVFATHLCSDPLLWALEPQHAEYVAGFITMLRKQPEEPITEQEEEALFSIMDLLSGKVIAVDDGTAPF